MVEISVIICTRNRAKFLESLLNKLSAQTLGKETYEVIVVDNASTDGTCKIVEKFTRNCHNFRYVYESKLGLSTARNRGIKEAKGEIIAFIDDDAIPVENWLEEHLKIYKKFPDIVSVGGKILLKSLTKKTLGKYTYFKSFLGYFDYSSEICEIKWPQHPRGGNFSILKKIGDEVNWFDEKLGRKGRNLISNEEVLFFYKIIVEKKYQTIYNPHALVFHTVSKERLKMKFFIKRYFYQGVSDRIMEKEILKNENFLNRIWKFLHNSARAYKKILTFLNPVVSSKSRNISFVEFFYVMGYLKELIFENFYKIFKKKG